METTEIGRTTAPVLREVALERRRQDAKFPNQELPNGTSAELYARSASLCKVLTDSRAARGDLTWMHILEEEFMEVLAEEEDDKLEAELVQVAAVAVRWVEAIRRRRAGR